MPPITVTQLADVFSRDLLATDSSGYTINDISLNAGTHATISISDSNTTTAVPQLIGTSPYETLDLRGFQEELISTYENPQNLRSREQLKDFYDQWEKARKQPESKNEKMTPVTFVKNRSHTFRTFLHAIEELRTKIGRRLGLPQAEADLDAKKRSKYWASRLFEPTTIYLKKLLYVDSLANGESCFKWVNVNKECNVVPIGMDIWGTIGGVSQASDRIDWGKVHLTFLPSDFLCTLIDQPAVSICFTTAESFELPKKDSNFDRQPQRNIEI